MARRAAVVCLCSTLAACAGLPRTPFTAREQAAAELPGYSNIRIWGDEDLAEARRQGMTPALHPGTPLRFLAISGGGAKGAFGAGLLMGWAASGTRPTFDVVSGVSTGALIAPFAFLGRDYDDRLKYIYTSGVTRNLIQLKFLPTAILGLSLVKPQPLHDLIHRYADEKMLAAVAAEHRKGRRLLIVTTNVDAQRPVVWNMGAIAASGRPGSLKLFQDILMASASIPAALPPVPIDVVADGQRFRELHSDGGAAVQVFSIPDGVLLANDPTLLPERAAAELYMIINMELFPEFEFSSAKAMAAGGRGIATIIKAQTRNSVISTYAFCKRAGVAFHIAAIDETIPSDMRRQFDPLYMNKLYDLGYARGVSGRGWRTDPTLDFQTPDGPLSGGGAEPALAPIPAPHASEP